VVEAIEVIHADGHDALVEPFLNGSDVEVPVILSGGRPHILPLMIFEQADPMHLRTYDEKRDLADRTETYRDRPFDDPMLARRITAMTEAMIEVFHPFDYGRFEFRVDLDTGDIQFLEVNLNCNLWSKKIFSQSAQLAGLSHLELIETILTESMIRQGVLNDRPYVGTASVASLENHLAYG
jgi:D-alanine-D-alanine ligase